MAAAATPVEAALPASRSTQSLDCPQGPIDEGGEDSVHVYVRVRPPTEREQVLAGQQTVVIDKGSSVSLRGDQTRRFTFDGVLGEDSTQEEVFDLVGRRVAASCLAGYNGSVYVYGQTGVGKTYTMSGPITSVQSMQFDERRGLISRTLDCVFAEIHKRRACTDGISYVCRCSFLEIYKEQVTDLLEPSNTGLQIREDMNRGVYVERLSEPAVSSLTEAFQVLWRGLQQRHIGATHINERSSRSHAVFTLSVEAAQTRAGVTSTRVARLSLVDLAGSERQQGVMDAVTGITAPHQSIRVKEAGAINKSLSALTNVVMSLSRSRRRSSGGGDGRRGYVHYRDSKLTFLLRDSLGGNSKTVIVANISPSALCYAETLSTLKFAARAKHIRCAAVRNEEFSGTLESLMLEVKTLRQRLADVGGPGFNAKSLMPTDGGTETPACSDPETLGSPVEVSPREEAEENLALYSRKRMRRLEVLLAAALDRERSADQRRHHLQRLADFLEDLDFRKTQNLKKLHADFLEHITQIETSAVSGHGEGSELTAKLLSCRHLLENLIAGSCRDAAGAAGHRQQPDEGAYHADGPAALRAAPGGTSDGPAGMLWCEVDAGTGAPTLLTAPAPGSLTDESSFLRDENRRLRLQLEQHPEVSRLASENQELRRQLEALNPMGGASRNFEKARTTAACRGGRPGGRGVGLSALEQDGSEPSDDVSSNCGDSPAHQVAPAEFSGRVPPLTSEMMLNLPETDDDGALRTWVYVQKMAKEVEDLLRAQESEAGLLTRLREEEGHSGDQHGLGPGNCGEGAPARGAPALQSVVEPCAIEEVAQATQDALRLAYSIADRARGEPLKLPIGSRNIEGDTSERPQARQALQKVKDLHGTLDLVNNAYNDLYDQFQHLREEYESRIEECQFFELQCSRLDMHCHELAERLHGAGVPVRAGMGSFSVTGFSPAQMSSCKHKRSFSLSSLRDVNFWEHRFEELSQLTGIKELESPKPQPRYIFQPPPRQMQHQGSPATVAAAPPVIAPAQLSTVEAHAGAATLRLHGLRQDCAVTASMSPGQYRQPPASTLATANFSPKALAYSTSLSSLQVDGASRQPGIPPATRDEPAFRRVASAPQIPCAGELRAAALAAPARGPVPPAAGAQGWVMAAPTVVPPEEASSLEQAWQMYMSRLASGGFTAAAMGTTAPAVANPVAAPSPQSTSVQASALGTAALGSTVRPQLAQGGALATTSSVSSLHGTLSSTAMRQLASNAANADLRREAPKGHSSQPAPAAGQAAGRHHGSGCRTDNAGDGISLGTGTGPPSVRTVLGRGTGTATARPSAQAGRGVPGTGPRGGSPRGMGILRSSPMMASGTAGAGRFPTARAAQLQRPHSLSLPRGRYIAPAAGARAGALQQRPGP